MRRFLLCSPAHAGTLLGRGYRVLQSLIECGVDCWIYPNINFGHYGVKGWQGNFDHFLRGMHKMNEAEAGNSQVMS